MSQISPPIRILFLCAVGFLAAWMFFLRPGEPAVEPVTTPASAPATAPATAAGGASATTAPGSVLEAANTVRENARKSTGEAAATTGAAPAATGASTAAPATAGVQGGEAVKAAARSGLPLSVLKGIADRKVVVLLFWNPKAADDRAVRRELRQVRAHRDNVVFHTASVGDIARYGQITRGVNVSQSPTLVVVDRKLQAEALTGYSDHTLIEQSIDDALRVSKK